MNFFKKIIKSTYDFKSYNYFFNESFGKSILYLFLLSLILTTFINISNSITFYSSISELDTLIENNVPNFEIKNGILKVDGEMPIRIEEETNIIIIDTQNMVSEDELNSKPNGIIFYEDYYAVKSSTGAINNVSYSTLGINDLSRENLPDVVRFFINILLIASFILGPLFAFLGKLGTTFIVLGVSGIVISSITKKKINYESACKLGAYSLTIPMIINALIKIIGITIPFFYLFYCIIAIVYLSLAINGLNPDYDNISYEY